LPSAASRLAIPATIRQRFGADAMERAHIL
jgi:hypothetical protein